MRINSYASTGQAIKAPFTFYYVRDNDWSESHNWDYWNKNFTSAASVDNTITTKTIYDPSVSGFALPRTAAFTGFTKTGDDTTNSNYFNVSGNWNNGWNFYTNGWNTGGTIFFAGLGKISNGSVLEVRDDGYYWTAGASSTSKGRYLDFIPQVVYPQHTTHRSAALTIRSTIE